MNSTVSKSSPNIRQDLNEKITLSESQQAEIFCSPLSVVSNADYISSKTWSEESYPEIISSTSNYHTEQALKNVPSMINSGKKNTNKRMKIIIINIIILLVLIVIAMIVTLSIVLKLQNTINNTKTSITTGNVNSYPSTSVPTETPIIYEVGSGGAVSGDPPCSSHTVVNDPSRNVATSGTGGACDNGPLFNTSIGGRWIRFMGIGGTIMPLTSPGINHCGAFLSGWFNESLPSTIGTIVSGGVCFELYDAELCGPYYSVSVVNCGGFYVYFLPPVILCNSRYCTV